MSTLLPRIAVGQMKTTVDKFANIINAAKCAGRAKEQAACMLFLPECFGYLGFSSDDTLRQREPAIELDTAVNDPAVVRAIQNAIAAPHADTESINPTKQPISLLDGMKTIAKESGLWITATMHTVAPSVDSKPRIYNTHFVMDSKGSVRAQYNKIHLFDVCIPGKVTLRESATTNPGTELILCDSPIGKLGITICYDVRFPEVYVELVKRGAQVLLIPAAFTVTTGHAHWHTLLKGTFDCFERRCFFQGLVQLISQF
jgi:predicted amidohydrolase